MTEDKKWAYRYLLHLAMLDIRMLCQWEDHYQQAGALADWLHNLASYSQYDFRGFEEDSFWKGYERYRLRFPVLGIEYKDAFEDKLRKWEETNV